MDLICVWACRSKKMNYVIIRSRSVAGPFLCLASPGYRKRYLALEEANHTAFSGIENDTQHWKRQTTSPSRVSKTIPG